MALRQSTPYSDLEFAILTKNDEYKSHDNISVNNYFKNLTHYINFRVICLGETTLPKSYYGVNLDRFIPVAVNFDLGGKTPLGRDDKDYDLICTSADMHKYISGDYDLLDESRKDSKLTHILENICYICTIDEENRLSTNTALVDEYDKANQEYLVKAYLGAYYGEIDIEKEVAAIGFLGAHSEFT